MKFYKTCRINKLVHAVNEWGEPSTSPNTFISVGENWHGPQYFCKQGGTNMSPRPWVFP